MNKTKKADSKTSVRLLCIYSDGNSSPGIGEVIELDEVEAERLVSIGAAEAIAEK
ncbi:MAG: hypothetical protein U5N55_11575 [Cypionkella sp.]|nr:hypothetical protein [Cypionkella sp.]